MHNHLRLDKTPVSNPMDALQQLNFLKQNHDVNPRNFAPKTTNRVFVNGVRGVYFLQLFCANKSHCGWLRCVWLQRRYLGCFRLK